VFGDIARCDGRGQGLMVTTAKALGLMTSPSLPRRADAVIR